MKRFVEHIRSLWRRLLELRDTPHAIAGGLAIGVFYGFIPLFGLKTLLSLLTAWLARCSKIAAVIAVSLHDLVLPFVPFLLRIQYDIGFWILNHHLPPHIRFKETRLSELFHWAVFHKIGLPLMLGSVVLAIPVSLIVYAIAYAIVKARKTRQLQASS